MNSSTYYIVLISFFWSVLWLIYCPSSESFQPSIFRSLISKKTCISIVKSGRGSQTVLTKNSKFSKLARKEPLYIKIEDPQFESWKLDPVITLLKNGALGVMPTDTSYTFVCDLHSKDAVERMMKLKQAQAIKKPLSLLCKDISAVSKYTAPMDKTTFKLFKQCLPGPYTLISCASSAVPKAFIESKTHTRSWKRQEVGIRIPNQDTATAILGGLDDPLLCSSVPSSKEEDGLPAYHNREAPSIMNAWYNEVDFVVDIGDLGSNCKYSTVVDLTTTVPTILREGDGPVDPFLPFM